MNKNDLYKKTVKLARETNKRLKRLEKGIDINKGRYNPKTKRFERVGTVTITNKKGKKINLKTKKIVRFKSGTWASKKLYEKIGDYITNNQISVPPKANRTQLISLNKAMRNFLDSKTSTVSGIREIERQQKDNISNILGDFDSDEISNDEIETLYDFFEDKDFNNVTKEKNIMPSDMWITLTTAKEEKWTKEKYLKNIYNYNPDLDMNDLDLKESLISIYNKYMFK